MDADKIMITDGFLFPENSDKPGIHSESQPARYISGQASNKESVSPIGNGVWPDMPFNDAVMSL